MLCKWMTSAATPLKNESRRDRRLKLLMAVAVLALGGTVTVGSVQAADLYRPGSIKDFPAPVVPACAIFHGFYIGGHVGGASHDWTWTDLDNWAQDVAGDSLLATVSKTDSGVAGGIQGGFNWQRGCTVLGFEADFSWADLGSTKVHTDGDNDDFLRVSSQIDGFGTLRTRAGVVVDSLFLYVTGGLAFADIDRRWEVDETPGIERFSSSDTRWGLTAGFGAEWALTDRISIKSEALWLRFEEDSATRICLDAGCANEPKRFELQDDVFTARIGLNFKFGGF
jgi:outer membrane immunogenic protein